MALTIHDTVTDLEDNPIVGFFGWAAPTQAYMYNTGSAWVEIGTTPVGYGTDAAGVWSPGPLPDPASCDPTPMFHLRTPLGDIYEGTVPEGVSGPLSIHDLLQPPYNWRQIS